MTKKVMSLALLVASVFTFTNAFAELQIEKIPLDHPTWSGVDFVQLHVDGYDIDVPVGNIERKNELYYIKKALAGDKTALEIVLADKDEKWFFVGITQPLWLHITKDGFHLVQYLEGEK